MKAKSFCIWNGDCSYDRFQRCPLEGISYSSIMNYQEICASFIKKDFNENEKCPPCSPEKIILFQVPRYYCKNCKKEIME